jgi:hypothetical protein
MWLPEGNGDNKTANKRREEVMFFEGSSSPTASEASSESNSSLQIGGDAMQLCIFNGILFGPRLLFMPVQQRNVKI